MKNENVKNRLNEIAKESKWLEKANYRAINEAWLDKSAEIALKVLRALRAKKMSQKDLADNLNVSAQQVSKIVKGAENLTLETISKLEIALGVILMEVPAYSVTTEIKPAEFKRYHTVKKKQSLSKTNIRSLRAGGKQVIYYTKGLLAA